MLQNIFTYLFNNGLRVSVVILIVFVVRLFFRNVPKKYSYILWMIVGIYLLCANTNFCGNKTEKIKNNNSDGKSNIRTDKKSNIESNNNNAKKSNLKSNEVSNSNKSYDISAMTDISNKQIMAVWKNFITQDFMLAAVSYIWFFGCIFLPALYSSLYPQNQAGQ